ncbi:DUF3866 family protein [Kineosporia sp. NBRC 101731]|uniref:DUF3866 family protein n=1 Tax=Kineosporia sp. NBRC 101731 TaxID=3032199 RepID=UPI0024A2387D|nr:DUF3866 family protein [Kineosporia sp. NBRC 101731]GLY31836.1 hypothetical protein Kisp02_52010 [Kineosporia sp. NBRC 101731]
MIVWREGRVTSERREWDGAVEYEAVVEGRTIRALAYPSLVGRPVEGQRVLLNVTALERGLGTGGYALVAALLDTLPPDPEPGPGHLVKARYTPLQAMVLGVDEQESPFHSVLADADDLLGLPVIVADLHSSLPAILAGLRQAAPQARVAYVMTDGGALPAWFSRTIAGLREADWLDTCITVGQAFGGDLEAVSVHSGLLAAKHVAQVDVAVVSQGPGNLGTGTRWGFSGVQAGEVLNAAAVLNGRGVATLRISGADARERHRGVSHHSLTAYGRVALAAADVVVPDFGSLLEDVSGLASVDGNPASAQGDNAPIPLPDLAALVEAQVAPLFAPTGRHREVRVPVDGLLEALGESPVGLSTMGRNLAADPAAFLAAAAAGRHAAHLVRQAPAH